jgi:hypothetical protein
MSYSVLRRTNEIGIRMALDANGGELLRQIPRETFAMVLVGIALRRHRRRGTYASRRRDAFRIDAERSSHHGGGDDAVDLGSLHRGLFAGAPSVAYRSDGGLARGVAVLTPPSHGTLPYVFLLAGPNSGSNMKTLGAEHGHAKPYAREPSCSTSGWLRAPVIPAS